MRKSGKQLDVIPKSCKTHKLIHVREDDKEHPYAVEIECEKHQAMWICVCTSLQDAITTIENFPLLYGGILSREDALVPFPDCILTIMASQRKLIE